MSKKLLAILAALSVAGCVVTACYSDDDNGDGGSCTLGQTACDGNSIKACTAEGWKSKVCPLGCSVNNGTASCNTSTTCTNGATQCVNNVSQICSNGSWVSGGSACGGGGTPVTDEPVAGASCDETTYEGGCSSDLTKRYYCASGALVEKSCSSGTSCVVNGNNSSKCESNGSGEACDKSTYTPSCASDTSGSYCGSQGTVVTVSCTADKPCVNNNGYIKCSDGSDSGSGGSGSGEACDKSTYTPSCASDTSGSYCGSQGTVVTVSCTADKPCVNNNGYIKCNDGGTSGGDEEVADCAPGGTVYCNKVCKADGSEGYYYSKGEVHTVECPDNNCSTASGKVLCGDDSGSGSGSTLPSDIPSSCVYGTSKGLCGSDGAAYVCGSEGTYYKNTKCSGTCFECGDGYWVACGTDEATACKGHETAAKDCTNETKIDNGGSVGDCCDSTKYAPSCSSMLRCDSSGHVAAITCSDGKSCTLNTNGKKQDGTSYDTSKYPLGYFECI